jgi:hypothetical protein
MDRDQPSNPESIVAPDRMDRFTRQEGDIEFIRQGQKPTPPSPEPSDRPSTDS